MSKILFMMFAFLIFSGCDKGLSPPPPEKVDQGIAGVIYYQGVFPDSLKEHRLIAAKMYRKYRSINEILNLVLSGSDSIQIYPPISSPSLPLYKIDTLSYRFSLPPSTYKYIAIVQTKGELMDSTKWKVVGVYGTNHENFQPYEVEVKLGEFVENVNIFVDYNNLPPQPFY